MTGRAADYAKWLVENEDKQGSPDFATVAEAYKRARQEESAQRPSLPIRLGANVWEGAAAIPGLPVEMAGLARGIPVEQSNLSGWGAKGWSDFFDRNIPGGLPSRKLPPAEGELERVADKAGQFLGSGAVFGPRAVVSAGTSLLGSEAGRAVDQIAPELTGGYGEVAGAVIGGVTPDVVRGQLTATSRTAPNAKQIKDTARAFYKQVDDAQVIINQDATTRIARGVRGELGRMAFRPKLQPKIASLLDEFDNSLEAGNISMQELDSLRRVAGNILRDGTPSEISMAQKVVDRIDDVVDSLQPGEVIAGDAPMAATALKSARDNWRRASKVELIEDAVTRAVNRAESTGTGGNTENAIRQNIRAILDNKKKARMFTRDERMAMVRVVRGGPVQNLARSIGGLSPDKGFFPMVAALGAAAVDPTLVALPVAGMAGRSLSEAMNARNVRELTALVGAGKSAQQLTQAQRAAQITQELGRRARLAARPATVAPLTNVQRNRQEQE
jgi:hypothetical protein